MIQTMPMFSTIYCFILIVWLVGVITGYTLGGLIHLLLLQAAMVLYIRFLERHKPS